ncbi:MAG TPA: hypothetical protein VF836_07970, partial [Gemmatimonadaceae bacterium]
PKVVSMMLLQLMTVGVLSASGHVGPRIEPLGFNGRAASAVGDSLLAGDTVTRKRARPHAIEYSDAYYTRLRIHHLASFTELPLFAAEYVLGQRLLNEERTGFPSQGLKTAHTTVALGLGALFTINTVTGGWNLWESRKDPADRTLRFIHSAAMLGADAGFAWSGASGGGAKNSQAGANHHRTIAISSMALATAGTAMMWLFHD